MSELSSSPKGQRALKQHEKAKEQQRVADMKWIMSDPRGRRFMFALLDQRCIVFSRSYTGSSETYLREGRRAVGIELMEELQEKFSDQYVTMVGEAFHIKKHDDLVVEAAKEIAKGDEDA